VRIDREYRPLRLLIVRFLTIWRSVISAGRISIFMYSGSHSGCIALQYCRSRLKNIDALVLQLKRQRPLLAERALARKVSTPWTRTCRHVCHFTPRGNVASHRQLGLGCTFFHFRTANLVVPAAALLDEATNCISLITTTTQLKLTSHHAVQFLMHILTNRRTLAGRLHHTSKS